MNPTGIEWVLGPDGEPGMTWNPWVGCLHRFRTCAVEAKCWAKGQAKRRKHICTDCYRFAPHAHPERLGEPLRRRKPTGIAVGLMGDLFGAWTPAEEIEKILDVVRKCPDHVFYFLTKNPARYRRFRFNWRNCVLGTTVNRVADMHRIADLVDVSYCTTFVSFEPLYEDVAQAFLHEADRWGAPKWIIIGGQARPRVLPQKAWVDQLIDAAIDLKMMVFLKDNLGPMKAELGNFEEMPTW